MKTAFDKIYCINFLPNKYRREFMRYQFNDLGLDVEFYDAIDYSKVLKNINISNFPVFGCSESHYHCIKKSQLLGYEKILILEDDVCFLKDKKTVEYFLNELPNDWEYIKYVFTLCDIYGDYYETTWNQYKMFNENFKNTPWICLNNFDNDNYLGSNCAGGYALNKNVIDYCCQYYEDNNLQPADQIRYLFNYINKSPFQSYTVNNPIMLPDCCFTISKVKEFKVNPQFNAISHIQFNNDDYYRPNKFLTSNICPSR